MMSGMHGVGMQGCVLPTHCLGSRHVGCEQVASVYPDMHQSALFGSSWAYEMLSEMMAF